MTPAATMPPISARGKVLAGLTVSSATFAAFSKPVIAKNASATPAMIAKTGFASPVLKSAERAEVGVALHDVDDRR